MRARTMPRPTASRTTRRASPVDWELRLGFLIHDVSRLRRSAFDRWLKPLGLTRSQFWVLACLSRLDGMTQSQLAEQLDLGKVAIGGLIQRLERSGFLRRVPDPTDRRVNRVHLEPKGRRVIAQLRDLAHEFNGHILAGIDLDQLESASAALEAMKRNLLKLSAPTLALARAVSRRHGHEILK